MITALIDDLKTLQNERPDNLVTFVQRSLRYDKQYMTLARYNSRPYEYQFSTWNVPEPRRSDVEYRENYDLYRYAIAAYDVKKANNFADERARLDKSFKVYQETEGLRILIQNLEAENKLYTHTLPAERSCEGWINVKSSYRGDVHGRKGVFGQQLCTVASDPANDPQYTSIADQIKLEREKSLKSRTAKRKKLNKRLAHQRSPRKALRKLPQVKHPKNPVSAARAFATKSKECTSYEHGYIVGESSVAAFTSYGVLSIDHAGEGVGIFSAKTQTKLDGQSARYFEYAAQWRAEYGIDVIDHVLQIDAQELFEAVYFTSSMHSDNLEWSMRDSMLTLYTSTQERGDATAKLDLYRGCPANCLCEDCTRRLKFNCDGPTVEKILRNMSGQVRIEIGRSYLGKSFMRLTSGSVTGIVVIS